MIVDDGVTEMPPPNDTDEFPKFPSFLQNETTEGRTTPPFLCLPQPPKEQLPQPQALLEEEQDSIEMVAV